MKTQHTYTEENIETINHNRWARIYSDALNPLILSVLIVPISAILIDLPVTDSVLLGLSAFFILGLLPYLFLIHRIRSHKAESVDLRERLQRKAPFLFVISVYAVYSAGLYIWQPGGQPYMLIIVACYGTCAMIGALVTRYWKVSLHSSCLTATWMVLFIQLMKHNYSFTMLLTLALIGFISIFFMGWARKTLQVHTTAQVVGGILFGMIIPPLFFSYFLF